MFLSHLCFLLWTIYSYALLCSWCLSFILYINLITYVESVLFVVNILLSLCSYYFSGKHKVLFLLSTAKPLPWWFSPRIFSSQSSFSFRHLKNVLIFFLCIISFLHLSLYIKLECILMSNTRWESFFLFTNSFWGTIYYIICPFPTDLWYVLYLTLNSIIWILL